MKRKFSEDFKEEIIKEYNSGNTLAQSIADKLNLKYKMVASILHDNGLKSTGKKPPSTLNEEEQKLIIDEYTKGKTISELIKIFGYGRKKIRKVLRLQRINVNKTWNKIEIENTTKNKIIELRDQKFTAQQIAEETNLPKCTISNFIKEQFDLDKLNRFTEYDRIKYRKEEIIKDYVENQNSAQSLGMKYGCVGATIIKLLNENNIEIRASYEYISNKSKVQEEIEGYIGSLVGKEKIKTDRTILKNLKSNEIDIYIPEKKIGFEIDGIHYHSELMGKPKEYHLEKTLEANKQGVKLYHILDIEWRDKREIVKSIIKSKLGLLDIKIDARKCTIKELTSKEANMFFIENHIQGYTHSSIRFGIFFENDLVGAITFSKPRYKTKNENTWELTRFATKINTSIRGGFSKLLSHFTKLYPNCILISYADMRFSVGNVYKENNFNYTHTSKPNYHYFRKQGDGTLLDRINFQKFKLKKKFPEFYRDDLTEWEIMQLAGYNRIWDCGNMVYEMKT